MIACIFGRTGSGKSTLYREIVRAADRAIIVDPQAEHADLGVCPRDLDDFRRYWARVYRLNRWRIVVQPGLAGPDPADELRPYLEIVAGAGTQFLLAIDEVDRFVATHSRDPNISRIVNYGRHWGIHVVAVARRTQAVPAELVSQCSHLYLFSQTRPGDVEYLRPFVGDTCADRLETLATFEYVGMGDGVPLSGRTRPA